MNGNFFWNSVSDTIPYARPIRFQNDKAIRPEPYLFSPVPRNDAVQSHG